MPSRLPLQRLDLLTAGFSKKKLPFPFSHLLTTHPSLPRQAMIDEFDLDQDGEINEQEFFAIMTDDA